MLPPEASSGNFEVRARLTVDALGEKDGGYGGSPWVIGGDSGTAGSCGHLFAVWDPTDGHAKTCPCSMQLGIQCNAGGAKPISTKRKFDFGTTLDVSWQVDLGEGKARIVVNGELEAEGDAQHWSFPRRGMLTLLAGDHDKASGKTEDLRGRLSDFAVYQPPLVYISWGWSFCAALLGCGLLYAAVVRRPTQLESRFDCSDRRGGGRGGRRGRR